jgi:hypothetical protein
MADGYGSYTEEQLKEELEKRGLETAVSFM